jgi:hypothetical protein
VLADDPFAPGARLGMDGEQDAVGSGAEFDHESLNLTL